jgi:hypothetical protein
MGIEASYRRVTTEEFEKLRADPESAASFFGTSLEDLDNPERLLAKMEELENSEYYLNIGKDWHMLHFLLTGDGELGEHAVLPPPPLGNVVQGGTETEWECTYGHVRFLSPAEVKEVANALNKISVGELRSRFRAADFEAVDIYQLGSEWTEDEAESVFEVYPRVVDFFNKAARNGDIILLSSD